MMKLEVNLMPGGEKKGKKTRRKKLRSLFPGGKKPPTREEYLDSKERTGKQEKIRALSAQARKHLEEQILLLEEAQKDFEKIPDPFALDFSLKESTRLDEELKNSLGEDINDLPEDILKLHNEYTTLWNKLVDKLKASGEASPVGSTAEDIAPVPGEKKPTPPIPVREAYESVALEPEPVEKAEETIEEKTFSLDFIKERIKSLLAGVPDVEIKNLEVNIANGQIEIQIKVKKKNDDIEATINLGDKNGNINVKNYNIKAGWLVKQLLKGKIEGIPGLIKSYIEDQEGRKVEKIEIVDGELKVTFSPRAETAPDETQQEVGRAEKIQKLRDAIASAQEALMHSARERAEDQILKDTLLQQLTEIEDKAEERKMESDPLHRFMVDVLKMTQEESYNFSYQTTDVSTINFEGNTFEEKAGEAKIIRFTNYHDFLVYKRSLTEQQAEYINHITWANDWTGAAIFAPNEFWERLDNPDDPIYAHRDKFYELIDRAKHGELEDDFTEA